MSLCVFQVPAAASQAPSLFGPEETQEVVNVAEVKPEVKKVVQAASSPEETNKTKKPAGAVSLFGGINVLGDEAKTTTVRMKTMPIPSQVFQFLFQQTKTNLFVCFRNRIRMQWRTLMILTGIRKLHHPWRPRRKRPRKTHLVCLMMMTKKKRNPMKYPLFPQQPSKRTKVH